MSWMRRTLGKLPLRWIFEVFYLSSSDPWRYWRSEFENQRYDEALRLIEGVRPATILEVGCSVGAFTRRLLALSPQHLTAVDISTIALRRARRALDRGASRLDLISADVFRDSLAVRDCDLIVAMDVLGYTDDLFLLRATRDRLLAALAPQGVLLIGNTKLLAQDGDGFAPFASGFPRLGARAIFDCMAERATRVDGFEASRFRLDLMRPLAEEERSAKGDDPPMSANVRE